MISSGISRGIMLARIRFEGIIKNEKKKSVLPDHVDIHVPPDGLITARTIFDEWILKAEGIKGETGVFHPLGVFGTIRVIEVVEVDWESPCKVGEPKILIEKKNKVK